MRLSNDQALQKGIEAHLVGKLKEAKQLYLTILEAQPKHPEANHNLGVLAFNEKKIEVALSFFKTALKTNPNKKQFWISYIDALIKNKQYNDANQSIEEAIKHGLPKEKFNILTQQLILAARDKNPSHEQLNSLVKYYKNGQFDKAEKLAISFTRKFPDHSFSWKMLGGLFKSTGRMPEALIVCQKAVQLDPKDDQAHFNLGNTFIELGKLEEAEVSLDRAIELNPDYGRALLDRGQILFDKGEFELSLKDFDRCNNEYSRARALISLYALGKIEDIYKRINALSEVDDKNIRVAAFASFIAEREKKVTAHNFCKNPLDFIYFSNISSHIKDTSLFIEEVIEELHDVKTRWEPFDTATRKGFQSEINLFENPMKKMNGLKSIIMDELDAYYLKFKKESCSYIKKWPSKNKIHGWHVILKQQGFQYVHIHSSGWLSGVIYLKVVPSIGKDEGAIEFDLSGRHYPDANSPKVKYQPKLGDIVFFPSSLHHRTIPFTTDTDRIIISFNLMPGSETLS